MPSAEALKNSKSIGGVGTSIGNNTTHVGASGNTKNFETEYRVSEDSQENVKKTLSAPERASTSGFHMSKGMSFQAALENYGRGIYSE